MEGVFVNTTTTINNCTFSENKATSNGAAIHENGANSIINLTNSIIYNNIETTTNSYKKQANRQLSGNNNIQFPHFSTGVEVTSNIVISDPLLSPLADNGGYTKTMALQAGSPAINAGSGCPTTDQRGATRVGVCDIGAYEFGGVLSIEDVVTESNEVLVYPNPSNGIFSIDIKEPQTVEVQLFDMSGRLLFQKKYTSLSLLPVEFNTSGTFLIHIQSETINITSKISIR